MQKTEIIVGGALFSAEGKLLLLRPATVGGSESWELPGGVLEFGEAPELATIRCVSECAGIDVSVDRPLGAWSELAQTGEANLFRVHIEYTLRCAGALTGVDLDRERFAGFAWVTAAEAQARVELPALRQSLERAFNLLARSRKNG